jgi:hypothetical protein
VVREQARGRRGDKLGRREGEKSNYCRRRAAEVVAGSGAESA